MVRSACPIASCKISGVLAPTRRKQALSGVRMPLQSAINRGSRMGETRAGIPVLRWLAEPFLRYVCSNCPSPRFVRLKGGCQNLLDVDLKGDAISRPLKNERLAHTLERESSQKGGYWLVGCVELHHMPVFLSGI